MGISSVSKVLLASAVLATGASFSAPTIAHATQFQLHELLFGRRNNKKRSNVVQPRVVKPTETVRKKAPPARKKIKRISGPTYYRYKAPKIATVTLASLATAVQKSSEAPKLGQPNMDFEAQRFAEAIKLAPEGNVSIEPAIADAVKSYYTKNPRFIWSRGSSVTAEAKALVNLLNQAADHGLDASDYAVNLPKDDFSLEDQAKRSAELLAFEFQLSAHAVRYAMDMKDGAVNPNKLSGYHDFGDKRLKPAAAMAALAGKDQEAVAYLKTLMPHQGAYAMLEKELKVLRNSTDDSIVFPPKVFMKPGRTEEVLPLLMKAMDRKMRDETRIKHQATIDGYAGTTLYDGDIVDLVRDVQRDLGLVPDGIVGPKTVSRLGVESIASKIERVKLAMERLRWHPENYGKRQVVINQPEYRVRYMENGKTKLAMRAIVGKPANQTYFFHDEIKTVVFNPYWGVPQSIIVNEMLPRLQRDPGYLDRAGYVVTTHGGREIASSSVNWGQFAGPVPYNVRQKPGPRNALGELKILFPNKHAIYMHDTPAKKLFKRDSRAYSHGCVRLEDPRAMAAAVLGKSRKYVTSQLNGRERGEKVKGNIPVYVAYFTAWPNDDGKIGFYPDVYKRDVYLSRALETIKNARNEAS